MHRSYVSDPSGITKGGNVTDELTYGPVPTRANHEPTHNNKYCTFRSRGSY
jgi:hypothetical protein